MTFTSPAQHIADLIKRDRWGRPLIVPPSGGDPIAYTRVSTLAKELGDKSALSKWMARQAVIGLAGRPDLIALVRSTDPENRRALDGVVKDAQEAAGSSRAANTGTALHSMTEAIDDGADPGSFGDEYTTALTNYRTTMAGIEVLAKEMFVVADEVQAAGTFDRLVRLPDGRIVVADIKTGSDPDYPMGATQQIAVYSHGHLYHPDQGRVGHLPEMGVDTTTGILIHLSAATSQCVLYELDITAGWALANTAFAVRQAMKANVIRPYAPTAVAAG